MITVIVNVKSQVHVKSVISETVVHTNQSEINEN